MSANIPDIREFENYFHKYYERLHHYAYTIVKDPDEAKDIVQAAFVKLWSLYRSLRIEYSIKSYLYRSVYNLSLNHIRDARVRQRYANDLVKPVDIKNASTPLFAKEFAEALAREIDKLPPQCRTVFLKSRVEEKKNVQIAGELGVTVKAVEGQITRALKILRENLGEYISLAGFLFLHDQFFFYG